MKVLYNRERALLTRYQTEEGTVVLRTYAAEMREELASSSLTGTPTQAKRWGSWSFHPPKALMTGGYPCCIYTQGKLDKGHGEGGIGGLSSYLSRGRNRHSGMRELKVVTIKEQFRASNSILTTLAHRNVLASFLTNF